MAPRSTPATLLEPSGKTGGTLSIAGRNLRFEPSDPRSAPLLMEITDIKRLHRTRRKVLGFLPLLPTGLDVEMKNEQRYAFTLADRKGWIATLDDELQLLSPKY